MVMQEKIDDGTATLFRPWRMRFVAFAIHGFYAIGATGISHATVAYRIGNRLAFVTGRPPAGCLLSVTRKQPVLAAVYNHNRQGFRAFAVA